MVACIKQRGYVFGYVPVSIAQISTLLFTFFSSLKFKQDHKALLELDNDMTLTTIIWRKVQQLLGEPHQLEVRDEPVFCCHLLGE